MIERPELRNDRLRRGNARYSLKPGAVENDEEFESKHPRDDSGKFGKGSGSKSQEKATTKLHDKPISEMPKPEIPQKMSQKFFEGMLRDIDSYGPLDDDDEYKKQAFEDIKRKLKNHGIDYVDAYHVTDAPLESLDEDGIQGSEVDSTGRSGGNTRSSSVYMFLDPDDIRTGYAGILGAKNETNRVIHIKIPLDEIQNMRWDSNYNVTFGTYSAVRIPGDVPPKWLDGSYEYQHDKKNSVTIYRHASR